MKIKILLEDLMRDLGLSDKQVADELEIDQRTVRKLRLNTDWRLDKNQLRRLMTFAFDKGYRDSILELEINPVWRTFRDQPVSIFRTQNKWDSRSETHLAFFVENLSSKPSSMKVEHSEELIAEEMRTRNCIFLGSPKSNPASEIALALLWGARPFDPTPRNRSIYPVQFLGMPVNGERAESGLLQDGHTHGFLLRVPEYSEPQHIGVKWVPPDRYPNTSGEGYDASVVAVRRNPLGTDRDVTTIVIAGYTGRATYLATKQLTHGEPPIVESDLESPRPPKLAAYRYRYRKRPSPNRETSANLRDPLAGTGIWGPPWPGVLTDK